jgi:hypothetical protein
VTRAPRTLFDCFLLGLAWCWAEQRDFLLIFLGLALVAIVLGLWAGNPVMGFGGVALLFALVFACIVYGSHAA